jgi:hypothetical protein
MQSRHGLSIGGGAETTVSFPVTQGAGLEVVVAQFWKTEGSSELEASVTFHGISPSAMSCDASAAQQVSISMVPSSPALAFHALNIA